MEKKRQNNIRQLRLEKKYTTEELANLCNIGRTSISQYENGKRTPSPAPIYTKKTAYLCCFYLFCEHFCEHK